ncbi:ATP-binding cassette domain-containing protein [Kribbella sp. NPDC003557]|uniref:ABC transporter ATP-binding protein n=1 Tax=Kribbella sp. NPDC003557 TaxID=3154449 RepID=UPI0033A61A4C
MLIAEDPWFRYESPWIVQDLSLTVEPGEFVGLCGPSGSGKSTIGRLLAGLLTPTRGNVRAARPDSDTSRSRGAHPVQLVLQQPERAMNPRWRVRDVLLESGAPAPALEDLDPNLVHPTWLNRFPHEISGGELQRVNLARALLAQPRYLVADEITASVDPLAQARIWQLLLDHASRHHIGVLAISHDQDLLTAVTSRTYELEVTESARGTQG